MVVSSGQADTQIRIIRGFVAVCFRVFRLFRGLRALDARPSTIDHCIRVDYRLNGNSRNLRFLPTRSNGKVTEMGFGQFED